MRRYLWTHIFALLLAAATPTLVQAQQPDTDAPRSTQSDDRDRGEWGWLGLLGLAGLLGLKRRDRTETTSTRGHAPVR